MIVNLTKNSDITNKVVFDRLKAILKFDNFYQSTETFLDYKMLYILDTLPIDVKIKESFILFINPTLENIEELKKCNNNNIIVYLFTSINTFNNTYQNQLFFYENCVVLDWNNSNTKILLSILESFYKGIYNVDCSLKTCDNETLKELIRNIDMYDVISIFSILSEESKLKYTSLLSDRLLNLFNKNLNDEYFLTKSSIEILEAYKRVQRIINKLTYTLNEYKYTNLLKITNYFRD